MKRRKWTHLGAKGPFSNAGLPNRFLRLNCNPSLHSDPFHFMCYSCWFHDDKTLVWLLQSLHTPASIIQLRCCQERYSGRAVPHASRSPESSEHGQAVPVPIPFLCTVCHFAHWHEIWQKCGSTHLFERVTIAFFVSLWCMISLVPSVSESSLKGNDSELSVMMMMSWCLMSSDVIWHIRDKLWPMPKHGSIKSTYVRCMRV